VSISDWQRRRLDVFRGSTTRRRTPTARRPREDDPPDRSTLSHWLKRATAQGLLCRSGVGYRGEAFLHGLPGRESLLWPGDHASEAEKQAWRNRCAEQDRRLREQPPSSG
jgi:hypothetical protein